MMYPFEFIAIFILVFVLGIVFGSFCNVLIYRIPKGEDFVKTPSHCMSCEKRLRWYELFPIFSYIFLLGRCSSCKTKLSPQYPIIELSNGLLWLLVFYKFGVSLESLLGVFLVSALLVLSVIDIKTKEIPIQTTVFIGVLAVIKTAFDYQNWLDHLLGFLAITVFLILLLFLSKGTAIGGGDVKLMAGCGLYLGIFETLLAFVLACIIGSIIHVVRMRFFGASRVLAMGPYLSVGVLISLLFGQQLIDWYINLLTI